MTTKKNQFRLNNNVDISGTSYTGEVSINPQTLIEKFGEPVNRGCDKVKGEYAFTYGNETITLYDWKYYDENVWELNEKVTLNIGSRYTLSQAVLRKFKNFLNK